MATAPAATLEKKTAALEKQLNAPGAAPDPAAQASLGWAYFSLGEYDKAKANLEQAAAQAEDPETKVRALQNLSHVLEFQGDVAGAKKALKKAGGESAKRRLMVLERIDTGVLSHPPV